MLKWKVSCDGQACMGWFDMSLELPVRLKLEVGAACEEWVSIAVIPEVAHEVVM